MKILLDSSDRCSTQVTEDRLTDSFNQWQFSEISPKSTTNWSRLKLPKLSNNSGEYARVLTKLWTVEAAHSGLKLPTDLKKTPLTKTVGREVRAARQKAKSNMVIVCRDKPKYKNWIESISTDLKKQEHSQMTQLSEICEMLEEKVSTSRCLRTQWNLTSTDTI